MALQLDVREGLGLAEVAAPPGEGDGECGQQDVVDARVESGGCLAQHGGGGTRVERQGAYPFPRHGVGVGRRAAAHRFVGARQRAPEGGDVGVEGGALQQLGPAAERRPLGGKFDGCARGELPPRRGQVLHEHPPGHTVDHDVVDDQGQLPCRAPPDGAQHGAGLGVQCLGGEGDARVEGPVALLPEGRGRGRVGDVEAPAVAAHQPGAEHGVPAGQGGENRVEGVRPEVGRGVQDDRLHEAVDGVGGLAEPLHHGGPHHGAGRDVAVVHGRGVLAARHGGQRSHGAVGEDLPCRDVEARLAQRAEQGDRQDAVPAELEEVLVDTDLVQSQERRYRRAHRAFVLGCGRHGRGGTGHGLRQRVAVDLAVGGEREPGRHDDVGGHHVLHHVRAGPRLDVVGTEVLVAGGGDDVAHEVGAARGVLPGDDAGVAHPGVFREADLDVLDLQAHAADLDLVVGAAEEVQRAVGGVAREVSGPVEPGPVVGEGVGHEPGRGQAGCAHVAAAQEEAADVEFTADADRDGAQFVVEDVELGVGVGLSDGRRQAFGRAPVDDVGDADGRLRRAVAVVEGDVEPGAEAFVQLGGQHLAAAPHVAQAVESPGVARHLQQDVQHGGDEVGEGDALFGDDAEQMVGVAFAARAQDHEPAAADQRQEDLVDGDVEGQRRLEQRHVVRAEAQDVLGLPQQPFADRLVTDHGALGPSGRPGGEDDVGEGVAPDGGLRCLGGVGPVAPVAEVDGEGLRFVRGVFAGGVELYDDPGVLDDDGPALGRPVRIERYERAAGPEHAEQPDDHVGGALQGDAHGVFRGEPASGQPVGQLGRHGSRLTVGQ